MFNSFVNKKYTFEFNNREFEIYDEKLIPLLLGKTGKQTAINTAGSAWKKVINRRKTAKQKESHYLNPKYIELLNFLKKHLSKSSDKFNYLDHFQEINPKELMLSDKRADKLLIGEFTRFREIMVLNLIRFKTEADFRAS
jgi:hypothetical protein